MPQGRNISNFEQSRSERDLTLFDNAPELYLHEANPRLLSVEGARARREALGAAASTPMEQETHFVEPAVEVIARSGAWIEYVRRDYLDRNWNLDDEKAA